MDLVVMDTTSTSTIVVEWEVVQAKVEESMDTDMEANMDMEVVTAACNTALVNNLMASLLQCTKRMHEINRSY